MDDTKKSTPPRPQSRRVLIAEDDPLMANAIQRVLKQAGHETVIVGDGFLAGSLLQTFRPSLMTLDLNMPCMNGLNVLDFLQGLREPLRLLACRVLVVSAESHFRIAQALSLGAHGAVVKPFSNEVLTHAVDRLLSD